jgi:hypothetical protein
VYAQGWVAGSMYMQLRRDPERALELAHKVPPASLTPVLIGHAASLIPY